MTNTALPDPERYPFRATVQTAHSRSVEFFETADEFEAFMRREARYCTIWSGPEDYDGTWIIALWNEYGG
jgi:hypothetical protein